jgi:hypothetical protein
MRRSSQPRVAAEVSKSVNHQLNMYALAAGAAGVGFLALAQTAEAKIVYTPAHVRLVYDRPLPLDLNHDGTVDFHVLSFNTGTPGEVLVHNVWACQSLGSGTKGPFCLSTGTNRLAVIGYSPHGRLFAAALRKGRRIRDSLFYRPRASALLGNVAQTNTGNTFWNGPWVNGGKGVKDRYLGLKFKIKGKFHFGWARLTITTTKSDFTATLTGYAYETIPGKAISAGATKGPHGVEDAALNQPAPQPATLGALAKGAPGLSVWRRKQTSLDVQ